VEIELILIKLPDFLGIFMDCRGCFGGLAHVCEMLVALKFMTSSFNHINVSIQLIGLMLNLNRGLQVFIMA